MSTPEPLEPLDADISALWDAEGARPGPTPLSADRVWNAVAKQIGLVVPIGSPPDGTGADGAGDPGAAPPDALASGPVADPTVGAVPALPIPEASAAVAAASTAAWIANPVATGVIGLLLGGIAGGTTVASVMGHSTATEPSAKAAVSLSVGVPVSPPISVSEPSAPAPVDSADSAPPVPDKPLDVAPPSPVEAGSSAGRDVDLNTERALLDEARTALMRGRAAAAIQTLQRSATQFPRGRLSQEREVVWIQALASSGQMAQARERAARFRQQYPKSLLLPAIEAAVR